MILGKGADLPSFAWFCCTERLAPNGCVVFQDASQQIGLGTDLLNRMQKNASSNQPLSQENLDISGTGSQGWRRFVEFRE